MKASSLAPVLFAATLFLCPILNAEDSPAPEMEAAAENPADHSARQKQILERFDKNKDGKLDEDEKAAAKEANREETTGRGGKSRAKLGKRALDKFDKNGDGKLDDAERAEAGKAIETDPRMVRRFDKDGDGKLNETEKSAARESLGKLREKRGGKND